jgi:hypothetical protein
MHPYLAQGERAGDGGPQRTPRNPDLGDREPATANRAIAIRLLV